MIADVKIREAINQVMLEVRVISEENNVTVDTFMVSPQRNKIEDLINKVANLTINFGNENDLINKVTNMTINDARNNLN